MQRRWIGIGWTLALLALLGHVAGADCCLIRDAVRETLDRAAAAVPVAGSHACCASSGATTVPAPAAGEDAALPECCGVNCAPIATLEASFALVAPASSPATVTFERIDAPAAPTFARLAPAPEFTGSPPEPAPRVLRGRAPPIA